MCVCVLSQDADVWSCGVLLYRMIFGEYPFDFKPRDSPFAEMVSLVSHMVNQKDLILEASDKTAEVGFVQLTGQQTRFQAIDNL